MRRALLKELPGWLAVVGLLCIQWAHSQNLPEPGKATQVQGTVEIQPGGGAEWQPLADGGAVENGNFVRAGAGSSVNVVFSTGSVLIGARSEVLFEGTVLGEGGNPVPYITVMVGGAVITWNGGEGMVTATENGIGFTQSGRFAVMQSKGGQTIMASLSSKLAVQDLQSQQEVNVDGNQFTLIKAGGPPESPKEISPKLLNLFNKIFPEGSMEASGASAGPSGTAAPSGSEAGAAATPLDTGGHVPPTKVVTFFDLQKILATINKMEKRHIPDYRPPVWRDPMQEFRFYSETEFNFAIVPFANPTAYPGVRQRVGFRLDMFALGLNYPFETQHEGGFKALSIDGIPSILDKIYFLDFNMFDGGLKVHLGKIRNFTVHHGGLIDNFSNELRSQIEQPLGAMITWKPSLLWDFNAFTPDVGEASIWGGNISYDNGYAGGGVAVVADLDQGTGVTYGDSAYRAGQFPLADVESETEAVYAVEGAVASNFFQADRIAAFAYGSLSLFISDNKLIGISSQVPGINIIYRRFSVFTEGLVSVNRAHPGYFDEFYPEDRARVHRGAGPSRVLSQTERHPPMGGTRGFLSGLDWQMLDKLWIGFAYGQNFGNTKDKDVAEDSTLTPEDIDLLDLNINRTLKFHIFLGENLFKGLKRAKVYYHLEGGGFGREIVIDNTLDPTRKYPYLSNNSSESFFASLNGEYGFFMEYSFLKNTSLVARFRGYSLDLNANGYADPDDSVLEFSTAWRMAF